MTYLFKILLSVIAGLIIGTIVALVMIFLGVIGFKFINWLSEKFGL